MEGTVPPWGEEEDLQGSGRSPSWVLQPFQGILALTGKRRRMEDGGQDLKAPKVMGAPGRLGHRDSWGREGSLEQWDC